VEQQMAGLLMSGISCMQRGIDGHDFANSVIVMHGELEFEALVNHLQTIGVPMVIALAKSMPQAGPYITKYQPQFTRFLTEFVAGPDAPEDMSDEDDRTAEDADHGAARAQSRQRKETLAQEA
jgi:hypothetical protein